MFESNLTHSTHNGRTIPRTTPNVQFPTGTITGFALVTWIGIWVNSAEVAVQFASKTVSLRTCSDKLFAVFNNGAANIEQIRMKKIEDNIKIQIFFINTCFGKFQISLICFYYFLFFTKKCPLLKVFFNFYNLLYD